MNKNRGRASVFDDSETIDIDIMNFTPKPDVSTPLPPQEQVKAISEAANFPSRQAAPAVKPPAKRSEHNGATEPVATSSLMPRHPKRR